jgi:hypothetical protein
MSSKDPSAAVWLLAKKNFSETSIRGIVSIKLKYLVLGNYPSFKGSDFSM